MGSEMCIRDSVRGADGRRLAKRHGDTRLDHYRDAGVQPQRIIGLPAWWCGLIPARQSLSSREFLDVFDVDKLPSNDVIFSEEDETWLTT